jgi:hypothetical protein
MSAGEMPVGKNNFSTNFFIGTKGLLIIMSVGQMSVGEMFVKQNVL